MYKQALSLCFFCLHVSHYTQQLQNQAGGYSRHYIQLSIYLNQVNYKFELPKTDMQNVMQFMAQDTSNIHCIWKNKMNTIDLATCTQ